MNNIKENINNKKEEKNENLNEEIVIKDSEEKNNQGITNSLSEKNEDKNIKFEKKQNKINNINFQSQNCFKFAILGNNNSNLSQELKLRNKNLNKKVTPNKENKYLIRNNIPNKENKYLIKNKIPNKENNNFINKNNIKNNNNNKYLIKNKNINKDNYNNDYISATERILNKSRSIYQNEKNIRKEEFNLNSEPINKNTKYFTNRQNFENILNNRLNIYNNYEKIINNNEINNEKDNDIQYDDDINEDIKSYTTPKINRNLPPFFNINNYQNLQTPIIINNNRNIIINKAAAPKTNRLIIKNDALFELLNDYIIQDTTTENILENLALCPDFNLINLFQSFLQNDYLNKNNVTAVNIYQTLTNMGLNINIDDIVYIYLKFNKKMNQSDDPGFTYGEFCELVTPKKYSIAKNLNNKENKKYFLLFSFKTQRIICSLFKQFIDGEKSNEKFRKNLIGNENNMYKIYYCVENLFNSLKKNNKDGIDENDIYEFMKNNGRKLYDFEVELLMDRFDKNKDELIDFAEFYNEIKPKL